MPEAGRAGTPSLFRFNKYSEGGKLSTLALGLLLLPLGSGADLGHGFDVAGGLRHAPLAQDLRPVHADCKHDHNLCIAAYGLLPSRLCVVTQGR